MALFTVSSAPNPEIYFRRSGFLSPIFLRSQQPSDLVPRLRQYDNKWIYSVLKKTNALPCKL